MVRDDEVPPCRAAVVLRRAAPDLAPPAFGVSGEGGGSTEPRALPAGSWTVAAWLAARSAKSLSRSPSTWWAGTYRKSTERPSSSASMRTTSSWLATGLPADVFQPLRFQPGSQVVTAFMAYWESIRTSSGTSGSVAASRRSSAVSSATLLVALPSGPASQRAGVSDSSATTQAQPAGPGFPFEAPSHAATTRSRMAPIMPRPTGVLGQVSGDLGELRHLPLGRGDVDHREARALRVAE